MNQEVIIIGAGGHAKVIADIVRKNHDIVYGYLADSEPEDPALKLLGTVADYEKYKEKVFIIAIGNNGVRARIEKQLAAVNYYTAVHPAAVMSEKVQIGVGTCVMAGAVMNENVTIGKHCIINTNTTIEHDTVIEDFVHISPRSVLCGSVRIGEQTQIGAGTTVINNVSVGSECMIGAGAAVIQSITEKGTYVGVPAKKIK